MGIFGSIIGGTLGLLAGGPLGMILGGVLGAELSSRNGGSGGAFGGGRTPGGGYERVGQTRNPRQQAQELQTAFAVALTSLAAKVAKADGKVTQDEIQAFDHFLQTDRKSVV